MEMMNFKYIDLFAGCGGLSLGLKEAGWEGIFAIEKSPDAFQTLKYNLINNENHFNWPKWLPIQSHAIDDIIKNHGHELIKLKGEIDLLAGGPPCQGFSTAGRRVEKDERNKLIDSYINFVELLKPKAIFFENVRGFTFKFSNNKKSKDFSAYVLKEIKKLGYNVEGKLINFSEFGIPQNRTRFILFGIKEEEKKKGVNPSLFFHLLNKNKEKFLKSKQIDIRTTLSDAISDLLIKNGSTISPDNKNFEAGLYSKPRSKYQTYIRKRSNGNIPDSHRFANHRNTTVQKLKYILENAEKNKSLNESTKKRYNIKKHTIIPLAGDNICPTITTLPDDYIHYSEPRILTVREYARIQSFPDWFKIKGKYTTGGKMRTKEVPRYSQIGNAIPPLFAEQAGLVIKEMLSNE
jgi:DNA (cytosine-5)-methyltransferase 1